MKETIRIELTQGQYQRLKEIGLSNSEIKSYGCTHPSSGVTIDHYMAVGVKKSVTGGNHAIDNIDTTPIQVESLAGGAEWNGEGLPPVGVECEILFEDYPNKGFGLFNVLAYHGGAIWVQYIGPLGNNGKCYTAECSTLEFRKPETEAERNERERIEAAYDLYLTRHISMPAPYHYDEFLKAENTLNGFLAIVDKTGYRKAVTNG